MTQCWQKILVKDSPWTGHTQRFVGQRNTFGTSKTFFLVIRNTILKKSRETGPFKQGHQPPMKRFFGDPKPNTRVNPSVILKSHPP